MLPPAPQTFTKETPSCVCASSHCPKRAGLKTEPVGWRWAQALKLWTQALGGFRISTELRASQQNEIEFSLPQKTQKTARIC